MSIPPISGTTVANKKLQYDVYQTILKYLKPKKCQKIESITIKNTSTFYKEELWIFNACNKTYHTTITYQYDRKQKKTSYDVQVREEEKIKKYHAKIYTLPEYTKKLPRINKNQILFGEESLIYLKTKKLPKESIDKEVRKLKSLSLQRKYNSFENIINDKKFFNKYPIEKLSSYELETVIYTKDRALITFSNTGYYSFFRGYYFLHLNQNYITIFSFGSDMGCGAPIEKPYLTSEGKFHLPKKTRKQIQKSELPHTVTLDNISLANF